MPSVKLIAGVWLKKIARYVFSFRYGIRYFHCVSRFRFASASFRSGLAFELSISIYAHLADLIGYARRICALSTADNGRRDGKNVRARPLSSRERVKASVVKSSAYPTRMKSVRLGILSRGKGTGPRWRNASTRLSAGGPFDCSDTERPI